jgi:LPS-assembly lipoprotein
MMTKNRLQYVFVFFLIVLGGCGFSLRQDRPLPFQKISLEGNLQSSLMIDLRRQLDGSGQVTLVSDPKMADVRVILLSDGQRKEILGYDNQGAINGFRLIKEAKFRFTTAGGRDIAPVAFFVQRREFNVSANTVLAREAEEGSLYQDMQRDLLEQITLRLSTLNPDAVLQ